MRGTPPSPLWTIEDVAIRLALAKQTIYNWRQIGKGPPSIDLAPRVVRYRPSEVERWLDAHTDQHGEIRP